MKKIVSMFALVVAFGLLVCERAYSQVSSDAAVLVEASVNAQAPSITLHWKRDTLATLQRYYRRTVGATSWGNPHVLKVKDSTVTDTTVAIGTEYEYRFYVTAKIAGSTIIGNGYIRSGIGVSVGGDPGRCILVVDTTYASFFSNELKRLQTDLLSEGYLTTRFNVSAKDTVPLDLKVKIDRLYESDPDHISTLFLFGHVPVPYSGFLNPDGHPNHFGAWPADVFYGDDNENDWTDADYDTTAGIRDAQRNLVGDGKFDQVQPPTGVLLKIGRVDLHDMPSFAKTEKELLKQYLDKDHAYRTGALTAPERGLVDDNFGYFSGEAFAASGWRNFSTLVGADSIHELDWFTTLAADPYLWVYGCGGGYDQGASGIGATSDFASKQSRGIFTQMFGSYFGDWNVTDNFLRAPLCSSYGLICSWSGRPYTLMFPMAMGHTTGDGILLTQNNTGDFAGNILASSLGYWLVHIDLMGDPTLRIRPFLSPQWIGLTDDHGTNTVIVSWPPDTGLVGYNVYRASVKSNHFTLLTPTPITALKFVDSNPLVDSAYYLVRGVRNETTKSGNYLNLGYGAFDLSRGGYPDQSSVSKNAGSATDKLSIIYPSIGTVATIVLDLSSDSKLDLEVVDVQGRTVATLGGGNISAGTHQFDWNFSRVSDGLYFVRAVGSQAPLAAKILVRK